MEQCWAPFWWSPCPLHQRQTVLERGEDVSLSDAHCVLGQTVCVWLLQSACPDRVTTACAAQDYAVIVNASYLPCSLQRLQMLLPQCCCLPQTRQSCPYVYACLTLQLAPGPIRFDVPESAKDRSIAGKFRSPINL